jgi:antitoxin HigA-1
MLKRGMKPAHPGVLIRENIEGLRSEGKGVTIEDVANALGITRKTLSNVMNGHQGISPAMAIRLSECFGTTAKFWLNVQRSYDLFEAEKTVQRQSIVHLWETPLMAEMV